MKTRILLFLFITAGLISCDSRKTRQESNEILEKGSIEMSKIILDSLNNDYSTAIKYFSESTKLDSKNFAAQYWKMNCEMRMNKLEDAKKTFKTVLKNGLNDKENLAPCFYVSAGIIDKLGNISSTENFNKAIGIYTLRINKNRNDIDAIANKAFAYCYLNKKDDAFAFIESMIKNVDSPSILIDLKKDLIDFNVENALNEIIND